MTAASWRIARSGCGRPSILAAITSPTASGSTRPASSPGLADRESSSRKNGLPSPRATMALTSSSPSPPPSSDSTSLRLSASARGSRESCVTWDLPAHGARWPGRLVATTSTRWLTTASPRSPSSAPEVGSIQWRSSTTSTTGRSAWAPTRISRSASKVRALSASGEDGGRPPTLRGSSSASTYGARASAASPSPSRTARTRAPTSYGSASASTPNAARRISSTGK